MDLDTFMKQWLVDHGPEFLPGRMLMRNGPAEYVGAALAVRGTLYFKDGYTKEVRKSICACFAEFEGFAKNDLKWLWREDPREGPPKMPYGKAKLPSLMDRLHEDDFLSFIFTGGEQAEDASPWLFHVSSLPGWEAKIGVRGIDSLEFSVPHSFVQTHPAAFQKMFISFARLLKAEHGHAGFAFNLSPSRSAENESTEAFMANKMTGLDVGNPALIAGRHAKGITDHIKTVGWLTAINSSMLERAGGLSELHSALPADWFAKYDYGCGIVIQSGPEPEKAGEDVDSKPARLVLPNMALRSVRMNEIGSLHQVSMDGEPRLAGWAAEQWLRRLDIEEEELLSYKAKLLKEPKLTKTAVLHDDLVR